GWQSKHDNANSLVLQIEFAGRSILLTGDLEGDGLDQLMAGRAAEGKVDVLLSPHHGSRAANPQSFARWARPQVVVVSGGNTAPSEFLSSVYDSARHLFTTHEHGAIRLKVDADGSLWVDPTVDQPGGAPSTPM